jgi:hypothetical protein
MLDTSRVQGKSVVPPYARGSVSFTGGSEGESVVPPSTRGSVSLSRLATSHDAIELKERGFKMRLMT